MHRSRPRFLWIFFSFLVLCFHLLTYRSLLFLLFQNSLLALSLSLAVFFLLYSFSFYDTYILRVIGGSIYSTGFIPILSLPSRFHDIALCLTYLHVCLHRLYIGLFSRSLFYSIVAFIVLLFRALLFPCSQKRTLSIHVVCYLSTSTCDATLPQDYSLL